MKRTLLLASIFVGLLTLVSYAQKKEPIDYEFPAAMGDDIKAEYLKEFKKGKILFSMNCGTCHITTVKGKTVIPDFTPEQVGNYELRIANPKHQETLIEDKLLPEELAQIMVYFSYKKKAK